MKVSRRWSAFGVAVLAFVLAAGLLAPVFFFAAIFLVGPHGGALPRAFEPFVLIAAWAALLGLPAWAAARTYRWLRGRGAMSGREDPACPSRRPDPYRSN